MTSSESQKQKIEKIIGKYIKSNKNSVVENFYGELGFISASTNIDETIWEYKIPDSYVNKNIKE